VPRFVATLLLAGTTLLQNIDSRMDQVVENYLSNKQFMGAVLVARGDQVLLSKGYGSANLEWQIPNTPSNNGHKVVEHNGGIEGFSTELAYYPEDKLTVVVLGNFNSPAPGQIAATLAKVAHGEPVTLQSERKEITLDPKVLAKYVGAYQM